MIGLLGRLIPVLITVLSGVGIGKVLDKTAADKLPNYPEEGIATGLFGRKLIWFVISAVIGTILIKFLGKKLNIKILK